MSVEFITDNTPIETLSTTVKEYRKTATVKAFQVLCDFIIKTPAGVMAGKSGDYIAQGIDGEKWSVKKVIFEKTYEEIKIV